VEEAARRWRQRRWRWSSGWRGGRWSLGWRRRRGGTGGGGARDGGGDAEELAVVELGMEAVAQRWRWRRRARDGVWGRWRRARGEWGRREAGRWRSRRCSEGRFPQECATKGGFAQTAERDADTAGGGTVAFFLAHFADEEPAAHVAGDGLRDAPLQPAGLVFNSYAPPDSARAFGAGAFRRYLPAN
jgi:hypothetical protein